MIVAMDLPFLISPAFIPQWWSPHGVSSTVVGVTAIGRRQANRCNERCTSYRSPKKENTLKCY
jgi:hypothetical protein